MVRLDPEDADTLVAVHYDDEFWSDYIGQPIDAQWLPWMEDESGRLTGIVSLRPRGEQPKAEDDPFFVYGQIHMEPSAREPVVVAGKTIKPPDVFMAELTGLASDLRDEYQRTHGTPA